MPAFETTVVLGVEHSTWAGERVAEGEVRSAGFYEPSRYSKTAALASARVGQEPR